MCYAFSHNGQVHAPPAALQRERSSREERVEAGERDEDVATACREARESKRERERERGRERERTTMSGGVQVLGNRVSYLVDCVHRFGDAIL